MVDMSDVLICDANHGGLVLLDEYYKHTSNNLFFYDTYNKLSEDERKVIEYKYGVEFLDESDIDEHFVVIAPVHMPCDFKCDYTHHEFTKYLLDKIRVEFDLDFKIIQVSGVKGKTTTTHMISEVLRNSNVLLLNSNHLSYNTPHGRRVLVDNLSITPSSIITAINMAINEGIIGDVDYCVFEVSLGVIPDEFCGVLTNVVEDYPIAGGTSSASRAKSNVFKSINVVCDYETRQEYYEEFDCVCVSVDNPCSDVYATRIDYGLRSTLVEFNYMGENCELSAFCLSDFDVENLLLAVCVGRICGLGMDDILSNLEDMKTLSGRNSCRSVCGKLLVEDINPGHNTTSIRKSVENIGRYNLGVVCIIGGDYGITCEEIDEDRLEAYLETLDYNLILTGALGLNLKNRLAGRDVLYFEDLVCAVKYAVNNYDAGIIHVIYRSEYHRNIKLDELL